MQLCIVKKGSSVIRYLTTYRSLSISAVHFIMTIWKHFWFLWILLVISQLTKSDGQREIKNPSRQFSNIDITKVTKWTQTENVVSFCVTVLASQAIITSGWIILGKLFVLNIAGMYLFFKAFNEFFYENNFNNFKFLLIIHCFIA